MANNNTEKEERKTSLIVTVLKIITGVELLEYSKLAKIASKISKTNGKNLKKLSLTYKIKFILLNSVYLLNIVNFMVLIEKNFYSHVFVNYFRWVVRTKIVNIIRRDPKLFYLKLLRGLSPYQTEIINLFAIFVGIIILALILKNIFLKDSVYQDTQRLRRILAKSGEKRLPEKSLATPVGYLIYSEGDSSETLSEAKILWDKLKANPGDVLQNAKFDDYFFVEVGFKLEDAYIYMT